MIPLSSTISYFVCLEWPETTSFLCLYNTEYKTDYTLKRGTDFRKKQIILPLYKAFVHPLGTIKVDRGISRLNFVLRHWHPTGKFSNMSLQHNSIKQSTSVQCGGAYTLIEFQSVYCLRPHLECTVSFLASVDKKDVAELERMQRRAAKLRRSMEDLSNKRITELDSVMITVQFKAYLWSKCKIKYPSPHRTSIISSKLLIIQTNDLELCELTLWRSSQG